MPATPTPLPAHSVIQVRLEGYIYSQEVMNTFHYLWDSPSDYPDYIEALNVLYTALTGAGELYDKYLTCLSEDYSLTAFVLQPILPVRLAAVKAIPAVTTGLRPRPNLPTNIAAVIERRGALAERSNIGSLHLPAQVTGSLDDDTDLWVADHMNRLGLLAAKVRLRYDSLIDFSDVLPVLVPTPYVGTTHPIVDTFVQDNPRVQRRRTLRVGR